MVLGDDAEQAAPAGHRRGCTYRYGVDGGRASGTRVATLDADARDFRLCDRFLPGGERLHRSCDDQMACSYGRSLALCRQGCRATDTTCRAQPNSDDRGRDTAKRLLKSQTRGSEQRITH